MQPLQTTQKKLEEGQQEMSFYNIVEASEGDWKFENQTTACVVTLTVKDSDSEQKILLEYHQVHQLYLLLAKINQA